MSQLPTTRYVITRNDESHDYVTQVWRKPTEVFLFLSDKAPELYHIEEYDIDDDERGWTGNGEEWLAANACPTCGRKGATHAR